MAWIKEVPASTRHPKRRFKVCYRDEEGIERSGGIYPTERQALTWKKRIEKGKLPPDVPTRKPRTASADAGDDTQALATLETFGDFVQRWWQTWAPLHPGSEHSTKLTLNARILPRFGDLALPHDDSAALAAWTEAVGAWKADLVAEKLRPHTVNEYLGALSRIINAAVDVELFDRNPMQRRSGAKRVTVLRNLEAEPVDAWLTMPQLARLADAIDDRYRAMVILAGRAGLRFGECAALLWLNLELDAAYDDGAVAGVGRLTVLEAISDPSRGGKTVRKQPKSRAGRRTIALDAEPLMRAPSCRSVVMQPGHRASPTQAYAREPLNPAARSARPRSSCMSGYMRRSWGRARFALLQQHPRCRVESLEGPGGVGAGRGFGVGLHLTPWYRLTVWSAPPDRAVLRRAAGHHGSPVPPADTGGTDRMPSPKPKAGPPRRSGRLRRWRVPVAVASGVAVALVPAAAVRAGQAIPAAADELTTSITVEEAGGSQVGQQAPRLQATTTTGERFRLPAGKPAVLSFSAAWCDPVLEVSELGRIHRDLGERVAILGVGVDPTEPLGDLRDFAGGLGAGYGLVHDRDGAVAGALQVRALDSTVVFDAAGRIVYRDAVPTDEATLRDALAEAGVG